MYLDKRYASGSTAAFTRLETDVAEVNEYMLLLRTVKD